MKQYYDESKSYLVSGKSFNEIRDGIQPVNNAGGNFIHTSSETVYITGTTAAAFTAVGLGALSSVGEDNSILYGGYVFGSTTAEPGKPFAILQESGDSQFVTKAIMQGVCRAQVNITDSTHTYATIENGTLTSSEAGEALILWKPSSTGNGICLIDIRASAGEVGETLQKTVELVSGKFESSTCTTNYTKTVTLAVGALERVSGSTVNRPTVQQCEGRIRTTAGYFTPYAEVNFSASVTTDLIPLESEQPPASGSALAYIDGVNYSYPVQRFKSVSTTAGFALPYFSVGELNFATLSGNGIMYKYGNGVQLKTVTASSMVVGDASGNLTTSTVADTSIVAIPYNALGNWGYCQTGITYHGIVLANSSSVEVLDMTQPNNQTIPLFSSSGGHASWGHKAKTKNAGIVYFTQDGVLNAKDVGVGSSEESAETLVAVSSAGTIKSVGANQGSDVKCLCSIGGTFSWRTYH